MCEEAEDRAFEALMTKYIDVSARLDEALEELKEARLIAQQMVKGAEAPYKSRLVALLEGLEVVKPNEAANLAEIHLKAIGKIITKAARFGASHLYSTTERG